MRNTTIVLALTLVAACADDLDAPTEANPGQDVASETETGSEPASSECDSTQPPPSEPSRVGHIASLELEHHDHAVHLTGYDHRHETIGTLSLGVKIENPRLTMSFQGPGAFYQRLSSTGVEYEEHLPSARVASNAAAFQTALLSIGDLPEEDSACALAMTSTGIACSSSPASVKKTACAAALLGVTCGCRVQLEEEFAEFDRFDLSFCDQPDLFED